MAYNALNNLIDAYIYANGVQAITGQILNGVLKQMVAQLGSGYHLMGVAGTETVPASNDYAMAYFAATAGEYTDFGGITLAAGEVAVLLTSGNGSWSKQTIYNVPTGTADLENTANFITNAVTDLVNYYTKTEVDDTLADYPTLQDLATALADYYTKTEIDGQMGDVDTALADRYTKTETDTKLGDYYKKTETYDKDEVDSIVAALSRQEYIVAWDGLAAPDVSAIPAGVTVTYSGTTYTGTLAASASTVNKIYMVWNGTAYDMYGTSQDGGYSWVPMGTTSVDLSQYATKAEVSQLQQEVTADISQLEHKVSEDFVAKDNNDEVGLKDGSDRLYIADSNGNAILGVDEDGLKTTALDVNHLNGSNIKIYNDKLYVTDPDGYIVCMVDKNGVHTTKVNSKDVLKNSWGGKVMATYGDSITAVNNGDFEYPFNPNEYNWGLEVAKFFSMRKEYGRGIGGTSFRYRDHGGPVAWVNTTTGQYVGRNDSYNYDNYTGEIPACCTKVRGDGSSWLRLSSMFPASIRGTIDVILIMFHNDFNYDMDTDVEWIPSDTTDPEWAASAEYSALGGDYNIGTVKGGIASVVMKLQALMPQATIILMTPIGGVYTSSGVNTGDFNNAETAKMKKLADCVMDVAQRMSTPCINVYGNCGINTLNRSTYIADTIHPYTVAGRKKIGRAVSSGLISQVAL